MWQGLSGVRADRGYSYQGLEKLATHVRDWLNCPPTEVINTLRLFDGLDMKVRDRTGQDIPIQGVVIELNDSEGYSKYDGDRRVIEILASPKTYNWLEEGYPRGGYFVAHELGHCLLHTDQLVRLAQMPKAQQAALHRGGQVVAHRTYEDTEWQANAFASALLMPAGGLLALEQGHGELSPTAIAEHFRVSDEAASYRLELYTARKQQLLQPGIPGASVSGTEPSADA